MKTRKSL